jgi:hypothetical protein
MTQTDFEPNLSCVTLSDDDYTLLLNGESNYSVRMPMDMLRKKAGDKQKAIESTILNACNSYGIDYLSKVNVSNLANKVVASLNERWAETRGENWGKKSRPKLTSSNITELEISESLQNKGIRLFRDDQYIVLEDREGNQARSYIYKKLDKTVKKFEEELKKTQMAPDRETLEEILFCLAKNHPLLTNTAIEKEKIEEDSQSPTLAQQTVELTEDLTREVSFNEIADILSTSIKKDEAAKVISFCGMLLDQTNEDQLNIGFQAESSAGKSYIPMEVATYFPKKEIEIIASASPTAFYHDGGKWDNEKKAIIKDLRHKILIFLDMPHFQLLEKLRPMLSHDQPELRYMITDKSQKYGLRTKNVIILGYPSVFFCTTKTDPDEQEKTRMILLSPSTDQVKLRESLELATLRKSNPDEYRRRIQGDPKRTWLTDRILGIRQWGIKEVNIPENGKAVYARFTKEHPYLRPRYQRDFPRIFSFIKAHALLNCFNRTRLEGKPDTILATQADIDAGFDLYSKIELSNELGLSPYIYEIFSDVFVPLLDNVKVNGIGVTREDILKKHYEVRHKTLSPESLKREIIPQLELVGLIFQKPDPVDKRRMLIYPTGFSQGEQEEQNQDKENSRGEDIGINQKLEGYSDENNYPTVSTPISLDNQTSPIVLEAGTNNSNSNQLSAQDNRGQHSGVNPSLLLWEIYEALENQNQHESSKYGIITVSESMLKQSLISSGRFTAGEAAQIIKDRIDSGELTRLEFDVLSRKSLRNLPPKGEVEEGGGGN